MGELRKDYILDRWVIISPKRGKRPHELIQKTEIHEETCVFCPGHEYMTPGEKGRITDIEGNWKVRWFENKFGAVAPEGQRTITTDNRFYTFASSYGSAEILVETPIHKKQLGEFTFAELEEVLKAYQHRIFQLSRRPDIKYVSVFKNHGVQGGTSLIHSHSQILALPWVPPLILNELAASRKFLSCPYCQIIQTEKDSLRHISQNSEFVAFTPYASRYNYEVWIFPKKHLCKMDQINIPELAKILAPILSKITNAGFSYNMSIHYDPTGEQLHYHIEICPRIAIWAGFEINTDIIINSVAPEEAAEFYRNG